MKKIILLCILTCAALLAGCVGNNTAEKESVDLYFLSADQSRMVAEKREIQAESENDRYNAVVQELLKGPVNPELKRALHEGTRLLGVETVGTVITVNMNEVFNSGSDIERLWSRYTLIGSLCSLPGVQKVKILVEGKELTSISSNEPLGAMGKDDIVLDGTQNTKDQQVVTLYFSDHEAMYLVPESRKVSVKEGESIEKVIVNELIKGPSNPNNLKTLPAEVKVLSVETKEKVCFVNLSQDFINKNAGGSTGETLAIFSIVNSLCELEQVDKVQFLIEGQKLETFGHSIFNEPFSRNEDLLKPT